MEVGCKTACSKCKQAKTTEIILLLNHIAYIVTVGNSVNKYRIPAQSVRGHLTRVLSLDVNA